MLVTVQNANQPYKFIRAFKKPTRVSIQVRAGFTLTIGHEQGEVQNPTGNDGLQLTQANTSPPFSEWIQGELWYSASIANAVFSMIIWTATE